MKHIASMKKIFTSFLFMLIDIGAGDGEVTIRLLKAINAINPSLALKAFATEYSWTMKDRLIEKNFM